MMIRVPIFTAGAGIIGLGFIGMGQLDKNSGLAFLVGALTLGGGLLICGFFSMKMLWHGIMGAGILALLGVGRGFLNFPDFAKYLTGERERENAPAFEFAVMLICAFLLIRVYRAWSQERIRIMKES